MELFLLTICSMILVVAAGIDWVESGYNTTKTVMTILIFLITVGALVGLYFAVWNFWAYVLGLGA